MIILFCFILSVLFLYYILIIAYTRGFENYPTYKPSLVSEEKINVSILLPYRHYDHRLYELVKQIELQTNGSAEIILANDFAADTFSYESNSAIKILDLKENSPELNSHKNNKKEAIALGVTAALYEYIICLDADVVLADTWWETISSFILEKKPHFAAGMHRYESEDSWLNKFLVLEQDVLTATSIAALYLRFPTMCNGANMIFTKTAFQAVQGYDGLYHTNGGDDLFLYHRIFKKFPFDTHYIKNLDATAYTSTPDTFRQMVKQRVRWISKTTSYENNSIQIQAVIIFLSNFLFAFGLFIFPFFPILLLKLIIDIFFVYKIRNFYKLPFKLVEVIAFSFLYPFYSMLVFISYILKNRF
jgi:cellulose synthase/poly-beta-1,6-N-acetylglucosamine synthase-like glycosyltransferase